MSGFKFGFELETVSEISKWDLSWTLIQRGIPTVVAESLDKEKRNDYFYSGQLSLVNDGSILPNNGYGIEIRSYIFDISELDKFRLLFVVLKDLYVKVNARCGLHIHVSHPTKSISAVDLIRATEREKVRVRNSRLNYCKWNERVKSHYCACNQRNDSHVEFRWFNAAIDFRYVCKMVRLVDYYCKLVVGDTELGKSDLLVPGKPALV
jgi:hypothetical protein